MRNRQVVLAVLDGWGYRKETKDNAIAQAKKPNFDNLWKNYPHSLLHAEGNAVGLPEGQMGNSEVGHMTIGAGKPIDTDLVRINKAMNNGEFNSNVAFIKTFDFVKNNNSTLHVMGLISPGGVHSHIDHLFGFVEAAKNAGIKKLLIHAFTDGRDMPPQSAAKYIKELEKHLEKIGLGRISTVVGRYYAMDRDNNWDRIDKAEKAIFEGIGDISHGSPSKTIEFHYTQGENDEFLKPIIIPDHSGKIHQVKNGDGIFFFNFRPDRAREISKKILERAKKENLLFVTMTKYEDSFKSEIAFPPLSIENTMGSEISKAGLTQARVAETEKFAHATYFLNGGNETPYKNEIDQLIPSRKDVTTHDMAPKMRAKEITDKVIEDIDNGIDFVFVNFANADMVGHTANIPAIIEAIEEIDFELGRILEAIEKRKAVLLITADHGNAELNIDQTTGAKHTSHTSNQVPFIATDKSFIASDGTLADIAPTVLSLFEIKIPEQMTGKSLLKAR